MELDAESIFYKARSLPPAERHAYVEAACPDGHPMRARVEALLEADDSAGEFLATGEGDPTLKQTRKPVSPQTEPGQIVGRYKLLQPIGEGGFGKVWMAEQSEPVKRRVALKIIKLGMDTKQVIARFEAERQALAIMDHPNIAKVFDAGATDTGRPYFVMEYIRGIPIIEYCDTEKLDTTARLGLFTQVCNAIQHAHQKGIIHRDIKPSNVMITLHDGVPVPKVIDFGIAKATNAELTEKTLFTEHRQMVGTPAYMSPEQAEMSGLDIDTRADIYSLGVLLYELLTGTTPFANDELMARGYAEMMRIIREKEPHKPSTRLSTLKETASRTAECRRLDMKSLGLILRGDLDWIVMKCLEKDRTRRYETANGLASDILRHQKHEPVTAGPPGTSYKLRKFIRRNRGQVIGAGVVAAVLILGILGTSVGMIWALNEQSRADTEAQRATAAATAEAEARTVAEANEKLAHAETERAEHELARATEIKRLVTEMLQSIDPNVAQTADTTLLKTILEAAAARLESGEITDEVVAAELHQVIGEVYLALEQLDAAELHGNRARELRTQTLGETHLQTLDSMELLADTYRLQNRHVDSEKLLAEVVRHRREQLGEDHRKTIHARNNLAVSLHRQIRHKEADLMHKAVLEDCKRVLGLDHPETIEAMANYGINLGCLTLLDEGEPIILEALEKSRRVQGPEHLKTLWVMNQLGMLYRGYGRPEEAASLHREVLAAQIPVLGELNLATAWTKQELGRALTDLDLTDEAERMYLDVVEVHRELLDDNNYWKSEALIRLSDFYNKQYRYKEAEPFAREAHALVINLASREDARAFVLNQAACILVHNTVVELNDPAKALVFAERAAKLVETSGFSDFWVPDCLHHLAEAQHYTGDHTGAVKTQRRVLALKLMSNHWGKWDRFKAAATLTKYAASLAESTKPSEDDVTIY